MWNLFKPKQKHTIASPVKGTIIDLSSVHDEAFSNKVMGDGFAVIPNSNIFVSPIDGVVAACFPTGHAFGIVNDYMELIVHIGIDTVELQGKGFHSLVKLNDTVKKGDPLVEVDLAYLNEKGYDTTTMVILTNGLVPSMIDQKEFVEVGEDVASIV